MSAVRLFVRAAVIFLCQSVRLPVCPSVRPSVRLFVCEIIRLSVLLSDVCLRLFVCHIPLSACPSLGLFDLYIYLSVCLIVCLSVRPSARVSDLSVSFLIIPWVSDVYETMKETWKVTRDTGDKELGRVL